LWKGNSSTVPCVLFVGKTLEMLKSLGICLAVAGLVCTGPRSTTALDGPGNRFSALQDWQSQISSDLKHNKRYLPATRTRGKIGIVKYELTMNRGGWVLPGTRIVTADPDLGRVALLLLQQAQPFPAPAHFNLPDASFRVVVPVRFNDIPAQGPAEELEGRKLLECYEADRQELEYQTRKAALRGLAPPHTVFRMPDGCAEAKRHESERQQTAAKATE
jgi:hypothetical protein